VGARRRMWTISDRGGAATRNLRIPGPLLWLIVDSAGYLRVSQLRTPDGVRWRSLETEKCPNDHGRFRPDLTTVGAASRAWESWSMNGGRTRPVDLQVGPDVFPTDVSRLPPRSTARVECRSVRGVVRAEYLAALLGRPATAAWSSPPGRRVGSPGSSTGCHTCPSLGRPLPYLWTGPQLKLVPFAPPGAPAQGLVPGSVHHGTLRQSRFPPN